METTAEYKKSVSAKLYELASSLPQAMIDALDKTGLYAERPTGFSFYNIKLTGNGHVIAFYQTPDMSGKSFVLTDNGHLDEAADAMEIFKRYRIDILKEVDVHDPRMEKITAPGRREKA